MRGLSLLDILVVGAVVALLLYAGSHDFARYQRPAFALSPTPTPTASGIL